MGNRRKKRDEYLFDVKAPTQGRLRRRLRVGGALLAAVLILLLTSYGMYRVATFSATRLVFENPRFAIAQIVVQNEDGALTPERIVQFAGVRVGQNLLSVDLKQAQQNLELISLVRHAELRRLLPNRLAIRVDERVPVARLAAPSSELGESVFLIDREGVVIKPLKLSDGTVVQPPNTRQLPVLTGATLADARVGKKVESEQIYRALELLDKMAQSAAGGMFEVDRIDLSKPQTLVMTTRAHTVVKFDLEDFPQQLRRLAVILTWAQQRQRIVQMADLSVSRGVPVTFAN